MLIIRNSAGEVYLARRPSEGLWGGLWSFPEVDSPEAADDLCLNRFGVAPDRVEPWEPLRHSFSHYHLDIQPLHLRLPGHVEQVAEPGGQLWYDIKRPSALGLAAPVSRLLAQLDLQEAGQP